MTFSPTPKVSLSSLYPTKLDHQMSFVPSPLTGGALLSNDPNLQPGESDLNGKPWQVHLDTQTTRPSAFTSFKTTRRNMYGEARERVGIRSISDPAEVILINPASELMEGSLTTVFLHRHGHWVTPLEASGGQSGTTRRWALRKGLCNADRIIRDTVRVGEDCYISNGVRGFTRGRVCSL